MSTETGTAIEWVSLADACRVTARHDGTIKAWIAGGRFKDDDVRRLDVRRGTSQGYSIRLEALRRVHLAQGGSYWQPQAAQVAQAVPPAVQAEMARLTAALREVTLERDALRQQLRYYQAGGRLPAEHVSAAPRPPAAPVTRTPEYPTLPPEYLTLGQVCKAHKLASRDMKRDERVMPYFATGGPWSLPDKPWQPVEYALGADGQEALGSLAGHRKGFTPCGLGAACPVCVGAGLTGAGLTGAGLTGAGLMMERAEDGETDATLLPVLSGASSAVAGRG